jgi:hypothetical protein
MSTLPVTTAYELDRVVPPNLPFAPVQYESRYQEALNNTLRLYFNRIDGFFTKLEKGGVIDYIDFNTTDPNVPHQTGRVNWNSTDGTLEVDLDYDVVMQTGQEMYARVRNNTGSTIPNGTVVGFAGTAPASLLVSPYLADGSQPTLYILGIMTHDLQDQAKGYATVWGFVRDVNTSAFSLGDVLYASPTVAGGLTNVKPTAPNNVIPIAAVTTVGTTDGVIFVRPTITQQQYYGSFSLTNDYSPAAANTAYPIELNETRISNGVVIDGTYPSRIVVPQSGLYSIGATFQYSSSNASAKDIYSWVRKNGTDVARSSRIISLSGTGSYSSVALFETLSLNAGEYFELVFASTDTAVTLDAVPATAFAPGSPAVELDVTQAQQ